MLRKPIEVVSRRLLRNYCQKNNKSKEDHLPYGGIYPYKGGFPPVKYVPLTIYCYGIMSIISGICISGSRGLYQFRKGLKNEEYSATRIIFIDTVIMGFIGGIMWPVTLPWFIYDINSLIKYQIWYPN